MSYLQNLAQAGLIGSLIFSSCVSVSSQEPDQSKQQFKKITISFEIDDGPLRIVIAGDDVDVTLDGAKIDEDRIEVGDNWLQIKNKGGWPLAFGSFGDGNFGLNFVDAPKMHAWLGVDLQSVSGALAAHLDLDTAEVSQVVSVTPDSPAEKGGLREHDIVLAFDDESPATVSDLHELLKDKEPGDMLAISILRKGKKQVVEIELGETAGSSGNSYFDTTLWGNVGIGKNWAYRLPRYDLLPTYNVDVTKSFSSDLYGIAGKKSNKTKGKGGNKGVATTRNNLLPWIAPDMVYLGNKSNGVGTTLLPGKVLKNNLQNPFSFPQELVYTHQGKDQKSTESLEAQLRKMAKDLEALKDLVKEQQAKAGKRNN